MAKKKKFTPEQELHQYRIALVQSMERWGDIKINGCNDPGWPDGANMNLVRNHIMHYRFKMAEIYLAEDIPYPPECGLKVPPLAPDGYMASLGQAGRVERLRAMGFVLTTEF